MTARPAPIRLELAGVDTLALSDLCGRCPLGPLGCCAAPPAFTWADVGRIVGHGGRDWLLEQIAAGRLHPSARGLSVRRDAPSPGDPLRCTYHGDGGCTIDPQRRSATCNDYLCADAIDEGARVDAPMAAAAAAAHERLAAIYARWDREVRGAVLARWPDDPPWDAAFLDELGAAHAGLVVADMAALAVAASAHQMNAHERE